MWKEIGKALLVSVVIPVTVQVLQQLAINMAKEQLNQGRRDLPNG